MAAPRNDVSERVEFVLNGRPVRLRRPDPSALLVDYVRSDVLAETGTKLVCGEGGCGCCTVTIARVDRRSGKVVERLANACLRPVCTLDGAIVTTIEGIGQVRTALNPIQERVAVGNASQCGFCTPGWVMAMYGLLRDEPTPTAQQVEDQFAGNLCRCTGMRPILDAMQSFVGDPAGCAQAAGTPFAPAQFPPARRIAYRHGDREYVRPLELQEVLECQARALAEGRPSRLLNGATGAGIYKHDGDGARMLIDVSQVVELTELEAGDVVTVGGGVTLTGLREFIAEVVGREDAVRTRGLLALATHLKRVAGEQVRGMGTVAGNLMLVKEHESSGDPFPSDLFTVLAALDASVAVRTLDGEQVHPLLALPPLAELGPAHLITRVLIPFTTAATHVNTYKVARRVQNSHALVNAGFSCDLGDVVTRARLVFGGIARVAVAASRTEAYLLGRAWTRETLSGARAVLRDEIAEQLAPMPETGVSAAYRAALADSLFYKYFVAVAPLEFDERERSAGEPLVRPISGGEHQFVQAPYYEGPGGEPVAARTSSMSLNPGTARYAQARRATVASELSVSVAKVESEAVPTAEHVIAVNTPPQVTKVAPGNHGLLKASARPQATGEAKYTQDVAPPPGALESAFVFSREANARFAYATPLASLDAELRARHPEFIAYVTAADLKAPSRYDDANPGGYDPIFALDRVTAYGQPIGLVVAETVAVARQVAQEIQEAIRYDSAGLEPVWTIAQARALPGGKGVLSKPGRLTRIERPGSDAAWLAQPGPEPDKVYVTGEQATEGQAHFYLETQTALAAPDDCGGLIVYSSAQDLASVQQQVAKTLALPLTQVDVRVSRLGGGYGGKEVRPPFFGTAAAVAAFKLRRPVRVMLDRNTDMFMVGLRHPFEGTYHVLADRDGHIEKLRLDFACDAGTAFDCSLAVMELALLSAENVYNVATFQANGTVYRTNRVANTAFRSFGVIQCTIILEAALEHLAHELSMSVEDLRRLNFYRDATTDAFDVTPYGQDLKYARMHQVWDDLSSLAAYDERAAAVEAFNRANAWRKRGLSMIPIKYGISYTNLAMNQATAELIVYTDGTVLVHHGGIEMGQGVDTKVRQIVANTLGIGADGVAVATPDTASVANASSTGASTGTDLQGGAVAAAAQQLRDRLVAFCRTAPAGLPPDWEAAWSTRWAQIAKLAFANRIDLSSQASFASPDLAALDPVTGQLPPGTQIFYYFTYSAGASEVEIDVLTGEVTVLRCDLIYDAGQSVNPDLDFGQVEGGFMMGLGGVTTEQVFYEGNGKPVANGTWDYKIPCSKTIPVELNVSLLEYVRTDHVTDTPIDRYGIMSSKSTGEPPLVLAASVYFAIRQAIASARADRGAGGWFEFPAPATVERIAEACAAPARVTPPPVAATA